MFPGAGAQVYTNEAGEPLGWDYPDDGPPDIDDYYDQWYDEPDEFCDDCGSTEHEVHNCETDGHLWSTVITHARFTGTPRRECVVSGCKSITLDLE